MHRTGRINTRVQQCLTSNSRNCRVWECWNYCSLEFDNKFVVNYPVGFFSLWFVEKCIPKRILWQYSFRYDLFFLFPYRPLNFKRCNLPRIWTASRNFTWLFTKGLQGAWGLGVLEVFKNCSIGGWKILFENRVVLNSFK